MSDTRTSVIQATSAGVRDMADKSLRITFEFEPRYAAQAYAMFGSRGTACAVAALTQEASIQAAQAETIKADKPGPLCVLACQWCKEPEFWRWLESAYYRCSSEDQAKAAVLMICRISSRKELDTSRDGAERFHTLIREPFMCWKAD